MTISWILLNLTAAAVLLIWAVRMVQTGVQRAHGPLIRRTLKSSKGHPLLMTVFGVLLAIIFQSSTAVAILTAGFVSSGFITSSVGVATVLGADLGSALVIQILSFNLAWLAPVCLIIGGILFFNGKKRSFKQTGRILVGVALILISLKLLAESTAPLRQNEVVPIIVDYLTSDPISTFLFGAVFTWLIHSSIASILLIIAFVAQAIVPTDVAVALVLGANTGGAFIAVILARNLNTPAQVVPLSNFCLRGVAAVLVLAIIHILGMPSILSNLSTTQQIISFHIGFNMLLVMIGLPFIKPIAAVLLKIMSDRRINNDQPLSGRQSGLKEADIKLPTRALAATTRELLYLAESVQTMFVPAMDIYENFDKVGVKELKKIENEIFDVHGRIKNYLARVSQQNLSEDLLKRNGDLMMFADNMAAATDVIVNRLLKLAKERNEKALVFSDEGWRELLALHDRVLVNMQLAMDVLVSSDLETARQLIIEKNELSSMTQKSLSKHLERLSRHKTKSLETSNMHNETLRALRQVNSSFSSIAYSILDDAGQLHKTRLAK